METLELVLMIISGAGIVSVMALLAIKGKWYSLRMMAYGLMLAAERHITATGPEKMDAVLQAFYARLPAFVKKYMDAESFRSLLQGWYAKAKDFLDDGTVNGSIFESKHKT